jgi:hypothetical protein
MFGRGIRRFATTASKAAESLTETALPYHLQVSKAQGQVNGFVGGIFFSIVNIQIALLMSLTSHWKHTINSTQEDFRRDRL